MALSFSPSLFLPSIFLSFLPSTEEECFLYGCLSAVYSYNFTYSRFQIFCLLLPAQSKCTFIFPVVYSYFIHNFHFICFLWGRGALSSCTELHKFPLFCPWLPFLCVLLHFFICIMDIYLHSQKKNSEYNSV